MSNIQNFKEWRAEEMVKVFLLKSGFKFEIETFPTPMFDLFVKFKTNSNVKFAIEVKTKIRFQSRINKQMSALKTYRDAGLINIPVLLIKVDEKEEESEFDFLVFPSFKENKLLIRNEFKFIKLNKENFKMKMNSIEKWYAEK
ncbi:hypothetical protein [Polaribacter sp. Hel1_85]|uniref:hypothetical protein n=1 Tax=Polaribacter sp. Hel1_85 TaxID=1250005 RepID=UPI00052D570C|nr:hypothetical protein [Polaribacter sp. Hel1_85]KGL63928.1 hypothetical protein PHEL85_0970 [Polaribacter sp. Hel1_85]